MPDAPPLVALAGVHRNYGGLRPLRIQRLELHEGQTMALLGFDQAAAETVVNLVAGATVPDSGEVTIMGQSTASIADGEAWMSTLDAFGILTERAVLLDQMTAEHNLAVPLSLDLHDLPTPVRAQVASLAAEVGLDPDRLSQFTAVLSPLERMRVRLGRALAGGPRILLAEHPNASLAAADRAPFAALLRSVAASRRLAMLVLTADADFAAAVGGDVMVWNPATGELHKRRVGWRRWFS